MEKSAKNTNKKFIGLSKQELALVLITMIWGTTFVTVQQGLTYAGPFCFVGVRFGLAAFFTALISLKILKDITLQEILAGGLIGCCIFFGYSLQTVGLLTIPSSKSAFIVAMYVPLVPLLQWLILKKMPSLMSWVGIFLAFAGLVLLAGPEAGIGIGYGELLTLISAVAIALEVVLISLFAGSVDIRRVTVVQLGVTSIISFIAIPVTGEEVKAFSWMLLVYAGWLGLASAFIQLMMNWAQKSVSPTRATLIYAGEPVWAGVIGRLVGERLPAQAFIGAALVVAGVIVSELRIKIKKKAKAESV
jgi:drug/metabolite transporter (DMT)-like permease